MKANLIIKNSIILYMKMFIQVLIALYTTRVILQLLGVDDFGIYSLISGAVAMFGFFRAGLASSTIRFLAHSQGKNLIGEKIKIFNISILFHISLGFILFVVLELGLLFFFNEFLNINPERLETAKIISHFIILISCINILIVPFDGILNSRENFLYLAVIDLSRSLAILVLAILLSYTGYDKLLFYSAGMLTIVIMVFSSYVIYCLKRYEECEVNLRKHFDKEIMKSMLSFSSFELLGYSSGMISLYSTNLLINNFFGVAVNAAQGISNQISAQITSFSVTMMKAVRPAIVKSDGSQDFTFFENLTFNSGKYSFLILIFFATPFLIETEYILNFWLIEIPEWAIIFCRLQLIKNIIDQFFTGFGTAIGAVGKIKSYVIVHTINNILILPSVYISFKLGYPPYSLYFVLILYFSIFGFLINLYFGKKIANLNVRYFLSKIVLPHSICYLLILILCFALSTSLPESFVRLILVCFVSTVFIGIMTYYFLTKSETDVLETLINRLLSYLNIKDKKNNLK
jgi:O-antigen/teichoic acid export membrane protein